MAKRPTKAETLAKDLMQTKAQDIGRLSHSHKIVGTLTTDKYMASGLIVTIKDLNGNVVMDETLIADGLSPDTIASIRADIKRTYDLRLAHNTLTV